ncbi:MAG: nucleoside kinase [Oscillospiraceae bacterium]|nr:nucleoside kinase [Oscillospiraceae bacterium]
MKVMFKPKTLYEIEDINKQAKAGGFIAACEADYAARVAAVADAVGQKGASIVMISGPSASGKTTSARKLAIEFISRGRHAHVVSLDDFFIGVKNYPKLPDGSPDMENVRALDIEKIHGCLNELIKTGRSELPLFDFVTQERSAKTHVIALSPGDVLIIEGIHALNPLLSETVEEGRVFKLYAGLRAEYAENGKRIVATRDLRIARRLLRDWYFRGHAVERTLKMWNSLCDGEEKWIKPFKKDADMLLDTAFPYEPCVTAPQLAAVCADAQQGGAERDTLLAINKRFSQFVALPVDEVPRDSMIREFYGGLELPGEFA